MKLPKRFWMHPNCSFPFESIKKEPILFQKDCVEYIRADAVKRKPLPKKLREAVNKLIIEMENDYSCTQTWVIRELLRRAGGGR